MKLRTTSILLILLWATLSPAFAQSAKTISLKDGTVLKGQLLKLENGTYTIQSSQLGEIQIQESDVVGISSAEILPAQVVSQPALIAPQASQMKSQVEQMKGQLMADPAMMQNVQHLMEDEEIRTIISDPQFLQDVMSYDPERIMNNSKMQELMNNPKMKAIMNKAAQSTPTPQ